jgi:hypothetical protein
MKLKRPYISPLPSIGHTGTPLLIPVILRSSDSPGYCDDIGWLAALLNLLTGLKTLVRERERFV